MDISSVNKISTSQLSLLSMFNILSEITSDRSFERKSRNCKVCWNRKITRSQLITLPHYHHSAFLSLSPLSLLHSIYCPLLGIGEYSGRWMGTGRDIRTFCTLSEHCNIQFLPFLTCSIISFLY